MKFLICISSLLFAAIATPCPVEYVHQRPLPPKVAYSKTDFFADQKKLFCWSGPIINFNMSRSIDQIPIILYNDETIGDCRIICYPRKGLTHWESTIKKIRTSAGKNSLEAEHEFVRKISTDPKVASEYDIYGFFINAEDLVSAHYEDGKDPKFPCWEFLYKRNNSKWVFVKKVRIQNFSEKANFEFYTVANRL